ncbi:Protein kinase-like domain protein [Cordyceps fumosorosea ARSEF 2679]|uniref:Protein kinase-like domain protein n=1 Tax=Cordyceps fumosorosea (strain ARSEF 2679) TaxID=1081104 RepID=A0A167NKX9_CORFA|nr:Protein kinase-like domain protein [Cordyceps fumosorosea ARSEF 2679]OAA55666.1 Protein kinase-like domain protein [Cordyceps fumosorosea ARSEF 2679]
MTEAANELENPLIPVTEALILDYPSNYILEIAGYRFRVSWCFPATFKGVRAKIIEQHAQALEEARNYVPSSSKETIRPTTTQTRYITRHKSKTAPPVQENAAYRTRLDAGSFGMVYSSADRATGQSIAVKAINLSKDNIEEERAQVNAELKLLNRCNHAHIIELLGFSDLMRDAIDCYMPLRAGNLFGLATKRKLVATPLYRQVLRQILSALDFLEVNRICHRDVKPNNILYDVVDSEKGLYHFQLGDFGSASYVNAPRAVCGTCIYWAPEISKGEYQGFGVDIWALYVSLVHVQQGSGWPGPPPTPAEQVHAMVRSNDYFPDWRVMAREDPRYRATAAQCLLEWFNGDGLSQPASQVCPIPVLEGELPLPRWSMRHGESLLTMEPSVAGPSAADGHKGHPEVSAQDRRKGKQSVRRPAVAVSAAGPTAADGREEHSGVAARDRRKGKQPVRKTRAPVGAGDRKRKLARLRSPSPMQSVVWDFPSAAQNAAALHPSTVRSIEDVVMGGMEEDVMSVGGHNLRPRR